MEIENIEKETTSKIAAVQALLGGQCDSIKTGKSVFILDGDRVINKRSKTPLDFTRMMEKEWECIVNPAWHARREGERALCRLVLNGREWVGVVEVVGADEVLYEAGDKIDPAVTTTPLTRAEALELVLSVQKQKVMQKAESLAPAEDAKVEKGLSSVDVSDLSFEQVQSYFESLGVESKDWDEFETYVAIGENKYMEYRGESMDTHIKDIDSFYATQVRS